MRLFLPKYLSHDLPSAGAFTFSLTPDALEADVAPDTAVLFRAPDGEPRVLPAGIHNFAAASMLIFDGDGRLYEAGGELLANTDGRNGSPQLSVTIPSGGFLVAFGPQADARLHACKARAFEGGVLYNATMSVICGITGSYDAQANRLTVSCPPPEEETAATKRFLFIGNSATYFNGTPLKFKALCRAAGEDVSVAYCTFGSAYLHQYADGANERGAYLRRRLAEKRYDFAVLHDAAAAAYAQSDEALRVLLPLLAAWGADTCALFSCMLFGKHKLAPVVSPKKTVEGAVGGVVGGAVLVLIAAVIMNRTLDLEMPLWSAVVLGAVGAVLGEIGDLSFSVIKRQTGIKDYGHIFPGHGGVLDRFDSVLFVAPFAELLFRIIW